MTIFRSLDEAQAALRPCVLTIGNFDGCHLGHQSVFRAVARLAAERRLETAVLTFDPHPAKVVAPDKAPKLLSTLEQRCRWMAECGIGHVLILPFTRAVAALSPEQFADLILARALKARAVMVGENFRFGHRQAGDIETLRALGPAYGFDAHPLDPVTHRGIIVSSTEIRRRIQLGDVGRAGRLLGRFYSIAGGVVPGHGIGSRQTVPTLNLAAEAEVLPATGVYVTRTAERDGSGRHWPSITNVGHRPTFGGNELSIETYLLAPLDGGTPEKIEVEFTHRLRDERKFDSPEQLKAQILADVARAQVWHGRYNKNPHYSVRSVIIHRRNN